MLSEVSSVGIGGGVLGLVYGLGMCCVYFLFVDGLLSTVCVGWIV